MVEEWLKTARVEFIEDYQKKIDDMLSDCWALGYGRDKNGNYTLEILIQKENPLSEKKMKELKGLIPKIYISHGQEVPVDLKYIGIIKPL
jgi:hypothetical protein